MHTFRRKLPLFNSDMGPPTISQEQKAPSTSLEVPGQLVSIPCFNGKCYEPTYRLCLFRPSVLRKGILSYIMPSSYLDMLPKVLGCLIQYTHIDPFSISVLTLQITYLTRFIRFSNRIQISCWQGLCQETNLRCRIPGSV